MLFSVGVQTTTVLDTALVDQARAVLAHRPRLVTSNRSTPSRAGELVGPRKVMVHPVVPDERPHDDRSAKEHFCLRRRPKRCEPFHDGRHDERHAQYSLNTPIRVPHGHLLRTNVALRVTHAGAAPRATAPRETSTKPAGRSRGVHFLDFSVL